MNSEARVYRDPQEVAFTLATHISRAKIDKKAVEVFANFAGSEYGSQKQAKKLAKMYLDNPQAENTEAILLPADQKRLMALRQEISNVATEKLAEKKGKMSTQERISLLLQAKFKSGLSKEQRVKMYKEAGYTGDEILRINGGKMVGTFAINSVLGTVSLLGLAAFAKYDNAFIFLNEIPSSTLLAIASIAVYTASYAYITEQNLRLTKTFGVSTGTLTTGLFALGDRLLPEEERDWIARLVPIIEDGITRNGIFTGGIAAITGDAHKIIAGNLFCIALNAVYIVGNEVALGLRKKKIA